MATPSASASGVPAAMGASEGEGASAMAEVCHGVRLGGDSAGRMVRGGDVSIETLVPEGDVNDESEELLVEEISIDGLCGVY